MKHKEEYDVTQKTVHSISKKLNFLKNEIPKKSCFLGWDGCIDYLYSIVQFRESVEKWTKMESMKTFGELILNVVGSSAGIESVLKRKTSGGFTANICKGMNALGVKMFLVTSWGHPNIDEIFTSLTTRKSVELNSFSNPGTTRGLEFNDGKIMIAEFGDILNINWNIIVERVGVDHMINKIENSEILGFGYWSSIPHFDNILIHLSEDIFPSINDIKNKLLFIDLADTKKRNKKDINTMLKILQQTNEQIPLLLSLNDQEAIDVVKSLENEKAINLSDKNFANRVDSGMLINEKLNLSYLVVHTPYFATISTPDEHFWITQCYASKPKFTTSAGDHFNSGIVIGLACHLTPPEAVLMGNALTSIFIRTGNSPTFEELSQFISRYMEYTKKSNLDFP